MQGKTVIVTGANAGFGEYTTRELARMGATVIMACRSQERGEATRQRILSEFPEAKLELLLVDVSSQASIRAFVEEFSASHSRLDVLVNNAGIQSTKRELTSEGIERVFATNVLGYHLLTRLLMPMLERSPPARVVNIASDFAGELDLDDLMIERRRFTAVRAYKQSKAANRLLSWAWARRLEPKGITVNASAPGLVVTGLYDQSPWLVRGMMKLIARRFGRTLEDAASTAVYLASSPEVEGTTGGFFDRCEQKPCGVADPELEERLFEACERLTTA